MTRLAIFGLWTVALVLTGALAIIGCVTLAMWWVFSLIWDGLAAFCTLPSNRRPL